MTLAWLLLGGLLGWLGWKGYLGRDAVRLLALAGGAALALWLFVRGQPAAGLAVTAVVAVLGVQGRIRRRVAELPLSEVEARQILGLGIDASDDEILAAHRRIIAKVHPDQGGSAELARKVNAARDLLLGGKRGRPG